MRVTFIVLTYVLIGCGDKSGGSADDAEDTATHHDHSDSDLPEDFDDAREQISNNSLFYAEYEPVTDPIPESTEFTVQITLYDPTDTNTKLTDAIVTQVDSTMPAHGGHGMNVNPVVTDNGDGTWTAGPLKYHMPGHWVLHVWTEHNGDADRADFDIACCE